MRALTNAGTIALSVLLFVVCTAPPVPPPASLGVGLQASFILANPAGLLALDSTGHAIGRIIDLPAQSASATPVLHPSGKAIVFALTQQPDKKTGFGSDLYTVNLDGTGRKPVVQHESDNVFYAPPRHLRFRPALRPARRISPFRPTSTLPRATGRASGSSFKRSTTLFPLGRRTGHRSRTSAPVDSSS